MPLKEVLLLFCASSRGLCIYGEKFKGYHPTIVTSSVKQVTTCSMGEGGNDDFFTEWEESYDSFDDMGLHENLLRGIYAYGEAASRVCPSSRHYAPWNQFSHSS